MCHARGHLWGCMHRVRDPFMCAASTHGTLAAKQWQLTLARIAHSRPSFIAASSLTPVTSAIRPGQVREQASQEQQHCLQSGCFGPACNCNTSCKQGRLCYLSTWPAHLCGRESPDCWHITQTSLHSIIQGNQYARLAVQRSTPLRTLISSLSASSSSRCMPSSPCRAATHNKRMRNRGWPSAGVQRSVLYGGCSSNHRVVAGAPLGEALV